jgi:hypothetical protein
MSSVDSIAVIRDVAASAVVGASNHIARIYGVHNVQAGIMDVMALMMGGATGGGESVDVSTIAIGGSHSNAIIQAGLN